MAGSRWVVLSACIIVQSVGGLQYMFGSFSGALKSQFSLSQTQIDSIGTFATIGANTGFYFGYIVDRYGPTPVLVCAAVLGFSGFSFTWASLAFDWHMHDKVWLLLVFSYMQGLAQQTSDVAVIPTVHKLFPENRGSVIGLVKAFVGLSGSLATVIYILVDDATQLLIVLGVCYAMACIVGALVIHSKGPSQTLAFRLKDKTKKTLNSSSAGVMGLLFLLLGVTMVNNQASVGFIGRVSLFLIVAIYVSLFVGFLYRQKDQVPEGEFFEEGSVVDEDEANQSLLDPLLAEDDSSEVIITPEKESSVYSVLCRPVFWIVWITGFVTCGTGLMLIVNLGQLVYVVGLAKKDKEVLVSLLSILNCTGRLAGGFLTDFIVQRFEARRMNVLVMSSLTMSVAMFAVSTATEAGLFCGTLGVGFAYGLYYGTLPVIVGDIFGLKNLGTVYALMALAICCGSLTFAKFLFAAVYEEYAIIVECPRMKDFCKRGLITGDETCVGVDCIHTSFLTAGFLTLACACSLTGYLVSKRSDPQF